MLVRPLFRPFENKLRKKISLGFLTIGDWTHLVLPYCQNPRPQVPFEVAGHSLKIEEQTFPGLE